MASLIDDLGLRELLQSHGVDFRSGNFEVIYDTLASDTSMRALREELEGRVRNYFESLVLPTHATLYDALLLTLREKDIIATFNWDPLLVQAYRRTADLGPVPHMLFLHGNVAAGYCERDRTAGVPGARCATCGHTFTPTPLLFPIRDKEYRRNPFIAGQWDVLEDALRDAFILTVFGYGAPTSEAAARDLLWGAWTANESQELAQVEIIDIRSEHEVTASWQDFFVRQHFNIMPLAEHSLMFRHPRRSCDAFAGAILQNDPWGAGAVWRPSAEPELSVSELRARIAPLIPEEREVEETGRPFRRGAQSKG